MSTVCCIVSQCRASLQQPLSCQHASVITLADKVCMHMIVICDDTGRPLETFSLQCLRATLFDITLQLQQESGGYSLLTEHDRQTDINPLWPQGPWVFQSMHVLLLLLLFRYYNDLWELDLSEMTWTSVGSPAAGPWPAARSGCQMMIVIEQLYMYGGYVKVGWQPCVCL